MIMGYAMARALSQFSTLFGHSYSILLFAALWEAVTRAGLVRHVFLPPLSTVLVTLWHLVVSGDAIHAIAISLGRASAGLAVSVLLGVGIGLIMSRSRVARWFLDPFIGAGFPAPKIAFIPIFTLWFGIGHLSKVALVAFTCVFVVVIATIAAAAIPRRLIWSAQALGTPPSQVMLRIILPAALPQLFTGIRVCVPVALITAFTAEMISGGGGAGTELMYAQRFFETPEVYAYILLMLATGFLVDIGLSTLQRVLFPWEADDDPLKPA